VQHCLVGSEMCIRDSITEEDLEAAIARTRASVTAEIRQRFAEEAERFARV
jgi:hypothetical protein